VTPTRRRLVSGCRPCLVGPGLRVGDGEQLGDVLQSQPPRVLTVGGIRSSCPRRARQTSPIPCRKSCRMGLRAG